MSSRTVKLLLLASVLLIAFPVVAGASTARVQGMGIQGDYIKDYTNIYTYISSISCVGNVVYGELGNWDSESYSDDRAVGAIVGNLWDGKYGTLGIHLRSETPQLGQGDANTPVGFNAWDPNYNNSHSFDVMWGKKLGSLSLGLRVNRSYAEQTGDPSIWDGEWTGIKGGSSYSPLNLAYNQNVMGYGAGAAWEASPKFTLEGSVLYQTRSFEATDSTPNPLHYERDYSSYSWFWDGREWQLLPANGSHLEDNNLNEHLYSLGTWKNDGGAAYQLALRGLWQWQPNVLVVPVFKYFSFTQKVTHEYMYETTNPYDPSIYAYPDTMPDSQRKFVTVTESPLDITRTGWQLGLAGNWTLNQNDLLVMGCTVSGFKSTYVGNDPYNVVDDTLNAVIGDSTSEDPRDWYPSKPAVTSRQYFKDSKYDYEYTNTVMPLLFVALETHVNSWLTLRFGAQQGVFYSTKYVNNIPRASAGSGDYNAERTKEVTTKFSPFEMMLGAGFKFGNLQLDATVNPDFVHNGPYFISGQTTGVDAYGGEGYGNSLFPKVTATYTF
jgi:hypothetical protein